MAVLSGYPKLFVQGILPYQGFVTPVFGGMGTLQVLRNSSWPLK